MDKKISNFSQVASLRRYTISDGEGKDLDVIDCDNGNLRFLINAGKACDVMQVYHKGQNLSFISKNGFTKRELPFIYRFEGGMLYTAGLDSLGAREGFELHGSFHNTPAIITTAKCDKNGIVIEATIKNTALFGKNLVVKRKIFSEINSAEFSVDDTLINEGYDDENYCLLYHINLGYPLLDDGGRIFAGVKKIEPRTQWAAKNIDKAFEISDAEPKTEETCYFLTLNKPEITYENVRSGKKLTVSYSGDTLPHFVEWKSMAAGDYALGLEPTTSELDDRFRYKSIKSGEQIKFNIIIKVL